MKLSIWDTLSIGVLAIAGIIFIMVLAIFFNPGAPVNPYPPAGYRTEIPPTPTATLNQLPATWTPAPTIEVTKRPTSTPIPTSTPVNLK